jgi:radical SAM superfamily enzyme YgiQ (UPF0313 family)
VTPDSIRKWLAANEYRMDLPVQYMGNEPNALCRDWEATTLRWLIAASWPYEHAAGNQSVPAVCKSVTDASPQYLCDRFYLPATPRDLRMLERGGVPVFGIESKHELLDFDVVGTSISYLVLFMNFCKMLTMSEMPLRWKDRDDPGAFPMVIIGGQAYSAPAAMEPVADCIWLGEAETEPGNGGMAHVCRRIQQFKDEGAWAEDRVSCYADLAREFSYLHFPRFVRTFYRYEDRGLEHPSKQVSGYCSTLPGMTFPRRARKVQNMDMIAPLDKAPLLYADPALGAGDLEVARGCPAWCGFCRLSWLTKPYRQRTVAASVEHAAAWHRNMGAVELSPFSPDFPMHTQRKLLIAELLQKVNDEADSVAMRVDDFIADGDYILLQAVGGMDAVTLGLEGNSQRMRDLVGKGTSDADVIEAVVRGIRAGIRKFKLFMITNLPGEEPEDVMRIVSLAHKLADVRDQMGQPNVRIQFSWTPLLIEAGTPFQWFAPTSADHTLIHVAEQFRDLKIDFKVGTKAEPNKIAFFQLCQRASADAGEAVVDVIDDLDIACWGGVPRDMRDRLDAALRARGFANGLADCFDERYQDDLFGWEYLDTGVSKDLMWGVYRQMVEFLENTTAASYDAGYDERYHGSEWVGRCDTHCMGRSCGACSPADLKLRTGYVRAAQHDLDVDLAAIHPVDQSSIAMKVRVPLDYSRRYRFVANDHWRFSLRRAAYLAAHAMDSSLPEGFSIAKRSIRFATDGLDSRGTSGRDYAEFGLTRQVGEETLRVFLDGMRSYLAKWVTLDDGWLIVPTTADLRRDSAVALYRLALQDDPDLVVHRLAAWDRAEHVRLVLRQDTAYFGIASEEVNAKDYVEDMWVTSDNGPLALRMLTRGLAGPYQLYAALMGKASWIEATSREALRSAIFTPASTGQAALQGDLLSPACVGCGMMIPVTVLGKPWRFDYCPRCTSEAQGRIYGGLERVAV